MMTEEESLILSQAIEIVKAEMRTVKLSLSKAMAPLQFKIFISSLETIISACDDSNTDDSNNGLG